MNFLSDDSSIEINWYFQLNLNDKNIAGEPSFGEFTDYFGDVPIASLVNITLFSINNNMRCIFDH